MIFDLWDIRLIAERTDTYPWERLTQIGSGAANCCLWTFLYTFFAVSINWFFAFMKFFFIWSQKWLLYMCGKYSFFLACLRVKQYFFVFAICLFTKIFWEPNCCSYVESKFKFYAKSYENSMFRSCTHMPRKANDWKALHFPSQERSLLFSQLRMSFFNEKGRESC